MNGRAESPSAVRLKVSGARPMVGSLIVYNFRKGAKIDGWAVIVSHDSFKESTLCDDKFGRQGYGLASVYGSTQVKYLASATD